MRINKTMSDVQKRFLKSYGKLPENDSKYLEILQVFIKLEGVEIREEVKGYYAKILDFPVYYTDVNGFECEVPLTVGPLPFKDLILSCVLKIDDTWGKDDDYFSIADDVQSILRKP